MMATARKGKWGCGSLWATLPAPAQPTEGPQAHSPPLSRLLAGLTARIPAAFAPTQAPGPPHPRPRAARPPRGPGTRPLGITWRRRRPHQPIGAAPLGRAAQSEAARVPGSAYAATRAGSSLSLFLHQAVRTR